MFLISQFCQSIADQGLTKQSVAIYTLLQNGDKGTFKPIHIVGKSHSLLASAGHCFQILEVSPKSVCGDFYTQTQDARILSPLIFLIFLISQDIRKAHLIMSGLPELFTFCLVQHQLTCNLSLAWYPIICTGLPILKRGRCYTKY